MREIFGTKKEEVTGEGRKLNSEGFGGIIFSTNIVRVIN
jgi:hypothetical protein